MYASVSLAFRESKAPTVVKDADDYLHIELATSYIFLDRESATVLRDELTRVLRETTP